MIDEGLAEPDDAYREAIEILKAEAPSLPYGAVVVDEAQDMGEQAFRLIRAIVPEKTGGDRNSIFIVGDAHQRIYGRRATMTACGINVRGRSRQLRLNYRTSDEIRKWAVSVLEGVPVDDLDEGADSLKGYTTAFRGPAPELASFSSEEKEVGAQVEWILARQGTRNVIGRHWRPAAHDRPDRRRRTKACRRRPRKHQASTEHVRRPPATGRAAVDHAPRQWAGISGRGDPVPVEIDLSPAMGAERGCR
jgi:hypothetical protein